MARTLTRGEEILGALVSDDEWYATYGNASEAVRASHLAANQTKGSVDRKSTKRIPKPSRKPFKSVGDIGELRNYLKTKNLGDHHV